MRREVPDVGGDTLFAGMHAAYDALSDGLKRTLEGLQALHSSRHVFGTATFGARGDLRGRVLNPEPATQDAVHPVVLCHPGCGRKALYVNPAFTVCFDGWTEDESRALLHYLVSARCPSGVLMPVSVAPGLNRCTWHYALNDYAGHRRLMHRITIEDTPLS